MAIDPYRMRFRDRAVEARFRENWLQSIWLVRVTWVAVATFVYIFYSLLIFYASDHSFADLHWFRLLVCAPLLVVVLLTLIRRLIPVRHFDVLFPLASCVVFGNAAYSYALAMGSESLLYLYEMATLFVYTMSYFPALFRPILLAIFVNTVISYFTFWYVWLAAGQSWAEITVQTSLLMGLALTGLFAAYSKDLLIRSNFRAVEKAREDKREAERLARAADAASEAKSRFVAMVGHEFRTPLNAILGYSEVLQMKPSGVLQRHKSDEYLKDIHDSAQHLHRLVENVLSITTGPEQPLAIDLEEVDVSGIVSKAIKLASPAAHDAGVDCRLALDAERIVIQADGWMLAHMLDELLTNAIKFTPPSGQVRVDIDRMNDGGVLVSVTDNGVGMAPGLIERVFDPFFQQDDTLTRANDGLGLGLTLVKRMMQAHGGDAEIRSAPGEGTEVRLRFPALISAEQEQAV